MKYIVLEHTEIHFAIEGDGEVVSERELDSRRNPVHHLLVSEHTPEF